MCAFFIIIYFTKVTFNEAKRTKSDNKRANSLQPEAFFSFYGTKVKVGCPTCVMQDADIFIVSPYVSFYLIQKVQCSCFIETHQTHFSSQRASFFFLPVLHCHSEQRTSVSALKRATQVINCPHISSEGDMIRCEGSNHLTLLSV